ncbi:SGNH/GDSL hydrolase family protein, partial [Trichococcus collinsii]
QLAHIESTKADLSDLPSSAYVFKGSTTFAALPTTGNTLGDVRWTTDNLLNYAWTGTAWTPIGNGAFADGSVVTPKLADKATTIPKLNLETQHAILSKKLFNELEILPIEPKLGLFYQGNYSTASKYAAVIDKFSVSADHILKFSKKYNFILRKFTTDTTNTAVFMSGSELLIPTNPVDILYYSLEIYKYGDAWGTTYTQALVDEVKANFMIFKFSPKIKKRLVPNTISGLIDDGTNGNPQGTYTAATGWGVYDVTLEKGEMIYYDMWVLKGAQSLSKFNVDGTFKESIITTSAVVNTNIKGVYVATEEIEHLKFNHVFTTYPFKCYKIQPDDLKSPLFGKTINFIGDSYVANNTESIDKTWHYKLADKHQMTYNNYGINGNGIVGIRGGTTPMKDRFTAMANNADYIVVIGGENDANLLLDIEEFKTGLDSFIAGLVAKYPKGKICFFTPWNAAWSTRNYIQPYIDAMIERCDHWCVPIFDASKNAGLYSWAGPSYRGFFFQGAYDGAHLNEAGHNNFLTAGEAFLENL